MSSLRIAVLVSGLLTLGGTLAEITDPLASVEWLDVPSEWIRSAETGIVAFVPDDLPRGSDLLLLVEPPSESVETIADDYERATAELGLWLPVGDPVEQSFDNGWVFRFGVGIIHLDAGIYTGQIAVARRGNSLVRMWALADSDGTFNHYQAAIGTAIASVQDLTAAPLPATNAPGRPDTLFEPKPVDPAFGQGVTGAYVGVERGLSASAGSGPGTQQVFNPSTGRYETSMSSAAPGVQVSIADYEEIDLLLPDGLYRRRLPARGLASDLQWDRATFPTWWGTWSQQGDLITTDRGGYRTSYRVSGDELVSDRNRAWIKLVPAKSIRVNGTYARHDYRDTDAPRLALHADGSYKDVGGFMYMVGSAWNLVVPDGGTMDSHWSDDEARAAMGPGEGNYALSEFTLTLNDRDGRIWQVGVYAPPGQDPANPHILVINGYRLQRD